MANAARVFFWGPPIPGREQKALQHFNDVTQFYAKKKEKGEIESYEAIFFDHFSSELDGILIVRADSDKLDKIFQSDESVNFRHRAELLLSNYKVAMGIVGEGIKEGLASYAKQVAELLK
jgi:hypothetical protein